MEILARGTPLETDEVVAPGVPEAAPIVIERGLGECPHGFWYEARQDTAPLLVTVLDPILVAQPDLRAQLQRDIDLARNVSHRNLLACYGLGTAGVKVFTSEAWPGGGTVREFARERRDRDQGLDQEGAYTLCAHICNALIALHEQTVHGYITADTVHVSSEGRVLVGAVGIGRTLARTRGFSRFRFGGLLPNIAPEQVLSPPQMSMSTDVFGIAALFIELVTGQSLVEAGQPLRDLGLIEPASLVECLEQATDPESNNRQPDVATFKAELREALRLGGVRAVTRPPGELDAVFQTPPPAPTTPRDDDLDGWEDLAVPETDAPIEISAEPSGGVDLPPPPSFSGVPHGASPDSDPVDGSAYPDAPPPPPDYPYPSPGYPEPPPGYPPAPPGYPESPAGYPAPPPRYPEPPPGYPPAPPGYPGYPGYPPPGYPGYPPAAYPSGYPYGAPPPPYPYGPPPQQGYPAAPPSGAFPEQRPRLTPQPHPAVGSAPADPEAARRHLDELDRATRRIEGVDADAALLEYTENVGDGDTRFDLDDDDEAAEDDSGSTSMLGLNVEEFEETAGRLATIDGVEDTEAPAVGPTDSGTFFSSFSDEPVEEEEQTLEDDPDARYILLRDGEEFGPYSVKSLGQMIRSGRVRSVDPLRSEATGKEVMAVDLPLLRVAAEDRRNQDDQERRSEALASSRGARSQGRPWAKIAVGVVVAAAAGIAGWMALGG